MSGDPATLADKRQIVAAAIAAAGTLNPLNPTAWLAKVNDSIPYVAAMLSADSKQIEGAGEVADADLFVARYEGISLEETSQRLLVELMPEGRTEPETIRTHRIDSARGKTMQARLNSLKFGQRILVYKAIEKQSGNAARTARNLVHFQLLYTPPEELQSPPTQRPQGHSDPLDGGSTDKSSSPAPSGGEASSPAAERFGALNTAVKLRVVKRLREAGVSYPEPDVHDVDQFMTIITEEETTP